MKQSILLALFLPLPAFAAETHNSIAGREVVIWSPPESTTAQPLIIFSHGYHGNATQSRFLTEALAKHGYWVIAPEHDHKPLPPTPDTWDDSALSNRRDDITSVLTSLKSDKTYTGKIDFTRIGLAGHSLGGYTVLALAGAWPSWKLPDIRAVLAMAPLNTPFQSAHTLSNVTVPIMYQCGSKDSLTPSITAPNGAYDQTPAPKYTITFRNQDHRAWWDNEPEAHASITSYTLDFFDHYLKNHPTPTLTQAKPDVTDLRFEEASTTH